jgi:hypothetical protein
MSATNLKETYFTFKTLTKIHGEPTLETLSKLRKQIYANAEAVPNSKYGTHGYLGLVMTAEQFAKRCNTPFERPGAVEEVDTNGTQTQLQQRERQYQRDVAYIKEFAQMETIIFNQIRETVDEEYLAAYLDDTTGNFTCTIPDLMTYLIDTYAYISEEELEMKRAEVAALEYTSGQPMDIVFQQVNQFANLAELANNDISEAQKIAMAKVIIVKAGTYAEYITEWNRKTAGDKTWNNFMTFFRQAHKELRQSRPTLKDISMEANIMEQEKEDLQQAIIQLQLQNQEQILKTTLEQNQKQMATMMEQILKTLTVNKNVEKENITPAEQQEKKRHQRKPRVVKYCSKCHKNGCSAFKFSSHNDDDCKTYT